MTLPPLIKGALRSLTVWTSVVLGVAPELLPIIQENFSAIAPFIPQVLQPRLLQLIALCIFLLRLRTSASLAAKGGAA